MENIPLRLQNKIAVIFGAGGDVGRSVAKAFAEQGAILFLSGRSINAIQQLSDTITTEGGVAYAAKVDALNEQEVNAYLMEATAMAERAPEVRTFLADALQQGRLGLAALFQNIDAAVDEKQAWTVGSFYQALMSGVIVQWVIDPEHAPSAHDLAEALRMIAGSVQSGDDKRD